MEAELNAVLHADAEKVYGHARQLTTGRFSDDEPFVVPSARYPGFNNKLFAPDTRLGAREYESRHLIVRQGALKSTVRKFLSSYVVRVDHDFAYDEDSIRGVDWLSSYTCPAGSVQSVTDPLLTMRMTGHWKYRPTEIIYERAKSAHQTIAFVEGASHVLAPCTKCEMTPGQFGDTERSYLTASPAEQTGAILDEMDR